MPASPASLPTLWALCSLLLLLPLRSSISWPLGKFLFTFSLSNHFGEVFQGSAHAAWNNFFLSTSSCHLYPHMQYCNRFFPCCVPTERRASLGHGRGCSSVSPRACLLAWHDQVFDDIGCRAGAGVHLRKRPVELSFVPPSRQRFSDTSQMTPSSGFTP